jgi:MFS family permease
VTVFFATVADLYHGKHFGSIQGFVVLGFSLGGAISPWLAGLLHDRTGSYFATFVLIVGVLVACAVLMHMVAPGRLRSPDSPARS